MKLFLDTALIEEIKQATALGLCDGVTTNPSLVKKTGKTFLEVAREILEIVHGPVSLEAVSTDTQGMVDEARKLAKLGEQVVVKIPMTREGIKAVKLLSEEGIKTNVTLIFSASQALIAAKAGATYVSPFIGRLDDISTEGMPLISDIMQIFRNYDFDTEVIVASVRHPIHVVQAALIGAPVVTVPFGTLTRLFDHPLTDKGIATFLKDWADVPK